MNNILSSIQETKLLHIIPNNHIYSMPFNNTKNSNQRHKIIKRLLRLTQSALTILESGNKKISKIGLKYQKNLWEDIEYINQLFIMKEQLKKDNIILQEKILKYSTWGEFDPSKIIAIEEYTSYKCYLAIIEKSEISKINT